MIRRRLHQGAKSLQVILPHQEEVVVASTCPDKEGSQPSIQPKPLSSWLWPRRATESQIASAFT